MTLPVRTLDYGDRGIVLVYQDVDALAAAVAELIKAETIAAIAKDGSASLALSGGSTPLKVNAVLAQMDLEDRAFWDHTQVFWGDERWVSLASHDSNAGNAFRTLFEPIDHTGTHIHAVPTDMDNPESAAAAYEEVIRSLVPAGSDGIPRFDLILLGMGDDGHTASLFPFTEALAENKALVAANYVPKLDAIRITMTYPLLNAGGKVAFLVAGDSKSDRLQDVLEGPINREHLPSQGVRPDDGDLLWMVDEAAAAELAASQ